MGSTADPAVFQTLLAAAYRAHAYIMGAKQLKMFVKSLGEVFVAGLPEFMGAERTAAKDPVANVDGFAKLEEATRAYEPGHVKLVADGDKLAATFASCPYAGPCGEILTELIEAGTFTKRDLPCFRSDITAALINESTGRKVRYELSQYAPGFKCVSNFETF
jgi:hypothetical protein